MTSLFHYPHAQSSEATNPELVATPSARRSAAIGRSQPRGQQRLRLSMAAAAVVALSVVTVLPAQAWAAGPPVSPQRPATNADPLARYIGQTSCDPQVQIGAKATLELLLKHYGRGRSLGIVRSCGVGGQSEHKEGRAFDWGLNAYNPADKAAGDGFARWVVSGQGARQLGVMYIIWDKKIWSASRASEGWRRYTGASPHTDHIHVSLSWAGALKRTSFWTGANSTHDYGPCQKYINQPANVRTGWNSRPCPAPVTSPVQVNKRVYWVGQSGADVRLAQQRLGISADGVFGSGTRTAVMNYQRRNKLQVTGALDASTWATLLPSTVVRRVAPAPAPAPKPTAPVPPQPVQPSGPFSIPSYRHLTLRVGSRGDAVRRVQQVLGMPSRYHTGNFESLTRVQVEKFQAHVKLKADGVVGPATWVALEQREVAMVRSQAVRAAVQQLRAVNNQTLRLGSRGTAVKVAQQGLKIPADGVYGTHTQLTVWRLQRSVGLPRTGVLDARTWEALERQVVQATSASIK